MPAPIIRICTADDVKRAFGGEKHLKQAISDGNGEYDAQQLDDAIVFASGDVSSGCGNHFKIWNAAGEYPQHIVKLAAVMAVRWCWWIGTQGKAVPEPVQDEYKRCLDECARIAEAKVGLGADPNPPARRARQPIDNSDGGRRAVYAIWRRAGYLGRR